MQSVLIDTDLNGCAFVCGSFSFLDKISCGLALFVLQSYQSKLQFSGPFSILNSSIFVEFSCTDVNMCQPSRSIQFS